LEGALNQAVIRTDLKWGPVQALPDSCFTAVAGVFTCPDRVQQLVDFLLKLQDQTAFGVVANEIF
jgi:hypothetical protein